MHPHTNQDFKSRLLSRGHQLMVQSECAEWLSVLYFLGQQFDFLLAMLSVSEKSVRLWWLSLSHLNMHECFCKIHFNIGCLLVLHMPLLSNMADTGFAICVLRSLQFWPRVAVYMNVSFITALKFLRPYAALESDFQKQKKEKQAVLSGMKLMTISCLSCSTYSICANGNVKPSQNFQ